MATSREGSVRGGARGGSPVVPAPLDRRALKALFGTYWTTGGWRDASGNARQPPSPPAAEVEYARAAGYMFEPRPMTHDQAVAWLLRARKSVTRREATDAFVASLSTRRLDWRSALGSFAVARLFPDHRHPGKGARHCPVCGESGGPADDVAGDLGVLNFERLKWGGVRHLDATYAAFDLELFAKMGKPTPGAEDFAILSRLVESIRAMAAGARLDDLQRELGKHLSSSKDERRVLIEMLGYCGVLQHPDHPGFLRRFIPDEARGTASARGDWAYPVEYWRGKHGVNEGALAYWFGAYDAVRR
jgi:hypothetical protein